MKRNPAITLQVSTGKSWYLSLTSSSFKSVSKIALMQLSQISKMYLSAWKWFQIPTLNQKSGMASAIKSGSCSLQTNMEFIGSPSEASRHSCSVFAASTHRHCLRSQSSSRRHLHRHRNRGQLMSLYLHQQNTCHWWDRSSMKWYWTNWRLQKARIKLIE